MGISNEQRAFYFNFDIFSSLSALCKNFPYGFAPPNKMAAGALDKKNLKTTSPSQPLVQIKIILQKCSS